MAAGKFILYTRVSTDKQGRSGLGLEAQRAAAMAFLNGGNWELLGEVTEVESGKRADRPKLAEALRLCRIHGATLLIAKLDRLSRDVHFLTGLQLAGVKFVAADMPEANEMVVQMMAVVAQAERKMISARTKAALQAAKARGTVLGGFRGQAPTDAHREAATGARVAKAAERAADLKPVVDDLRAAGAVSNSALARELTARRIPAPRGGAWSPTQTARLLARIES